jgi:drug/metabolite transporter (DMT)-like permease
MRTAAATAPSSSTLLWTAGAPALFVVLWSTGFVAAKAGLPYIEPMTFLALRFGLVCAAMLPVALLGGATWPDAATATHVAVVGLLMHGGYLGGVFASIAHGLPAGLSALIVGLQPLLTACVVGPLLGERVRGAQWAGFILGLAGVALVLSDKLAFDRAGLGAAALSGVALVGITAGTLYQKRFCVGVDLRSGAVIQYAAATAAMLACAWPLETMQVHWTPQLAAALAWLCLPMSLGAVSLLMLLIRRGAAAKVASLFYLVPPLTALFAWWLFGETLGILAMGGMGLAALGVALVQRGG